MERSRSERFTVGRIIEDGSYYSDLYVADYGETPGDYNVHIYVIDESGTPIIVAGQMKTIN